MSTMDMNLYDTLRKVLNLDDEQGRTVTQAIEQAVKTDQSEIATKDFVRLELSKQLSDAKWDMIKIVLGVFAALALMIIGLYIKK